MFVSTRTFESFLMNQREDLQTTRRPKRFATIYQELVVRMDALARAAMAGRSPLLEVLEDYRKDWFHPENGPAQRPRPDPKATGNGRRTAVDTTSRQDGQFLDFLERAIEYLLGEFGIQRCRRIVRAGAAGDPLSVWTYYRPSEEELFEAVEDSHPLLLVVTAEQHRFIRALVARYGTRDSNHPVLVWTAASGLYEFEGVGRTATYHPIRNAKRTFQNARVELERLSRRVPNPLSVTGLTLPDDVSPTSLRAFLVAGTRGKMKEDGFDTHTVVVDGRRLDLFLRIGVARLDPGAATMSIVIDDESADGNVETIDDALEKRLVEEVRNVVEVLNRVRFAEENKLFQTPGPPNLPVTGPQTFQRVISHIVTDPVPRGIFILCDAGNYLGPEAGPFAADCSRALKDAYHRLRRRNDGAKLVLLSGEASFPADLREEVRRIDLPLPHRRELVVSLRRSIEVSGLPATLSDDTTEGHLDRMVDAAAGMTLAEVRAVVERFARRGGKSATDLIASMHDAKKTSVARSPALELIDPQTLPDIELGGLDRLTAWLDARRMVFERPEAARAAGIDRRPKGVLLLGIPGSGKSLAAKVVARRWALPLVRFDLGAIRDKWVGSSEARMRDALRTVEAMAPCVLWIDEIDKGIAQSEAISSSTADLNIRATLLTWMQECVEPVFVVATANRVSHLPPELMRSGRFDGRFFLGCPGPAGRREILDIHLKRRGIDPDRMNVDALVTAMHGYTGAEIEQIVLDALYARFNEGGASSLEMRHFEEQLSRTRPLIKTIGGRGNGRDGRSSLEEVWDLIEEGRVELASDQLLNRAQVAKLIDPYLYRPVYCRKEMMGGFDRLQARGERIVMAKPFGGYAVAVLDSGDEEWIYVHTNVRFTQTDQYDFKFLDRLEAIEDGGVFDVLVTQYGVERIYIETQRLYEQLAASSAIGQYAELFELLSSSTGRVAEEVRS